MSKHTGKDNACAVCGHTWNGTPAGCCPAHIAARDLLNFAKRFDAAVGVLIAGLSTNHAVAKDLIGLRDVARSAIARAEGGGECS